MVNLINSIGHVKLIRSSWSDRVKQTNLIFQDWLEQVDYIMLINSIWHWTSVQPPHSMANNFLVVRVVTFWVKSYLISLNHDHHFNTNELFKLLSPHRNVIAFLFSKSKRNMILFTWKVSLNSCEVNCWQNLLCDLLLRLTRTVSYANGWLEMHTKCR